MLNRIILALFFTICICKIAVADGVGAGASGPSFFPEKGGKDLYGAVCTSCHMLDAKGATGAGTYPALEENNNLSSATFLAYTIMYGKSGMPAFGGVLDDEQISHLVNYVRTEFGNKYDDKLTPDNIKSMRIPDHIFINMN